MGRRKLSTYAPEVAAKMRQDLSNRARQNWLERDANGLGTRVDGMTKPENRAKVALAIKELWAEGVYADRVDGMKGRTGSRSNDWHWGVNHALEIYRQHVPDLACSYCGKKASDGHTVDLKLVDENDSNYLYSNMQAVCKTCVEWLEGVESEDTDGKKRTYSVKTPFVTLGKKFDFEYAHVLPWHPGKCARLHGHSGHLQVEIAGRVDPNGIVEDFYNVSQAVKTAVIEPLDHQFLNDFLDNPTTENLLFFIWRRLEDIGLKGLTKITFSETDSSYAFLTKESILDAYGWDLIDGTWTFVNKKVPTRE